MRIFWQWDTGQPVVAKYLLPDFAGTYIQVRAGIVQYIRIITRIPYGEVQALLGVPSSGTFMRNNPGVANARYTHTAGYLGGQVIFDSDISCPITASTFWNEPVVATYNDGSYVSLQSMPEYDLAHELYRTAC
jgi:hypothetical protein